MLILLFYSSKLKQIYVHCGGLKLYVQTLAFIVMYNSESETIWARDQRGQPLKQELFTILVLNHFQLLPAIVESKLGLL